MGLAVRRSVLSLGAALAAVAAAWGVTSRPDRSPTPTTYSAPTDYRDTTAPTGGYTADGSVTGGSFGVPSGRPTVPGPPPTPRAALSEPVTASIYGANRNLQNELALYFGAPSEILFLGDSITDFLAAGLGKPLWDVAFEPLGALNFGVAAATTSHVLWQVETGQVAMAEPKVVVLMIGTNNLALTDDTPEDVAAGVKKIVTAITDQLPNTRVLLLGILPRGATFTPLRTKIAQTNELLADLAADRVVFCDIGSWFVSVDGTIPTALMPDGTHPSLLGYFVYAILIWDRLMELYHKE